MICRAAIADDLGAIEAMRRTDGDALGFIPLARYAAVIDGATIDGRRRSDYEGVSVITDSDEVTGFVFAGFHRGGLKIEQVCVREDARRIERATALVRSVEATAWARGAPLARCRVAADLEATRFWEAMGYTARATVAATFMGYRKSWSRRPLIHFERELRQLELQLAQGMCLDVSHA